MVYSKRSTCNFKCEFVALLASREYRRLCTAGADPVWFVLDSSVWCSPHTNALRQSVQLLRVESSRVATTVVVKRRMPGEKKLPRLVPLSIAYQSTVSPPSRV